MKWKDRLGARIGAQAVISIKQNEVLHQWIRDFSPGGPRCKEPNADIFVEECLKELKRRKKVGHE